MSIQMMIDLETLGLEPGSVILSIGAVVFDPNAGWVPDLPPYSRGSQFH